MWGGVQRERVANQMEALEYPLSIYIKVGTSQKLVFKDNYGAITRSWSQACIQIKVLRSRLDITGRPLVMGLLVNFYVYDVLGN